MIRLRGFLLGLAGGAIGAVLVLLVLILVLDFGEIRQEAGTDAEPGTPVVSAPSAEGLTPQEIYEQSAAGVVMVLADFSATDEFGQLQSGQALGTGFVVDDRGYIITNAHVVSESGQQASSVTVVFNDDGSRTLHVGGELVGVDQGSDIALIKVDPADVALEPLALGDSSKVVVGEPVVAIGNPLGYDFSITSGIVSATGRTLQAPNGMSIPNGIQTDAAINQGNSGGPLINTAGQVIGINEQIATQTGGNEGLGFAVPINTAKSVMSQLKKNGTVKYAWLGVAGQTINTDVADLLGMEPVDGALVEQVSQGSPADEAGLKGGKRTVTVQGQEFTAGGDVITKVDAKTITSFDDLITYLATKSPGDKVAVTVVRNGETLQLQATLAERPSDL